MIILSDIYAVYTVLELITFNFGDQSFLAAMPLFKEIEINKYDCYGILLLY